MNASENLAARLPRAGIRRVVAVGSGKGGVGKSLVAALFALQLRRAGQRVGLLDADVTGPSVARFFGVQGTAKAAGGLLVPAETKSGIKLASTSLFLEEDSQPTALRGPMVTGAIRQFFSGVAWSALDWLVIDLPPGTSDAALTVLEMLPVDALVAVATPQRAVAPTVAKLIRLAKKLGVPVAGVVGNMAFAKTGGGTRVRLFDDAGLRDLAEKEGVPVLASLDFDPALAKLCDEGRLEDLAQLPFSLDVGVPGRG